jgi:hypothetical protein
LNVGTYVEVPIAPVSQPKFEAWESNAWLINNLTSNTKKYLFKILPKA